MELLLSIVSRTSRALFFLASLETAAVSQKEELNRVLLPENSLLEWY